ncbi:MAG: hypothetical protein LBD54_01915 [Puniceicoccales bacterium]|nr:hypothetical protein [Puniceicoccales bacterium]
MRKLIFSCALCCSCLWFPASAFADWALEDILHEIIRRSATIGITTYERGPEPPKRDLTHYDLEVVGVLKEIEEMIREKNAMLERDRQDPRSRLSPMEGGYRCISPEQDFDNFVNSVYKKYREACYAIRRGERQKIHVE